MIELPTLPYPAPLPEVTLFAFDDWAFPFYDYAEIHLTAGANPQTVLDHGPEDAADGVLLYYGTVIRVGDTFHMWYNGNYGPLQNTIGILPELSLGRSNLPWATTTVKKNAVPKPGCLCERTCVNKKCGRKYHARRWNQRYCQGPACMREVNRWLAAR